MHQRVDGDEVPVMDSWAASVTADLERSRRTAWIVALVAGTIALLLAIALVILMPLKTTVPYTLMVNRQTGHVEALEPLNEATVSPDAALTRSFLAQYVISRESFDRASLQRDYRRTMLWSDGSERNRYSEWMNASNPSSPLALLPQNASIRTEISSLSPLSDNSSLVRFVTVLTDQTGRESVPEHWAAVVNYTFSGARMSEEDRLINPLGFQVTRYRRDRETLSAAADSRVLQPSGTEASE